MPQVSFLIGDPICYWSKKHAGVLKDFSKILAGRDWMGDHISTRGNGTGKESTAAEGLGAGSENCKELNQECRRKMSLRLREERQTGAGWLLFYQHWGDTE